MTVALTTHHGPFSDPLPEDLQGENDKDIVSAIGKRACAGKRNWDAKATMQTLAEAVS